MLETEGLEVAYGGTIVALRDVSIRVDQGSLVSILGNNGAGKTTLLRAISSSIAQFGGQIVGGRVILDGDDITGVNPADIVKRGLAQSPEGRGVFGNLTVEENLRLGGFIIRSKSNLDGALSRAYERFPALADIKRRPAGLLSGGEQQMLAVARALMASPRMLLLDEPSLGLAPKIVESLAEGISEIRDDGTTVLLVEQNASLALDLADYAYVLEVGSVHLSGTSSELREGGQVEKLYLGVRD